MVISDVASVPVPAYALLFGLLLGVDCDFHSVVEHAIGLVVVGDVEAHSVACSCVRHAEKEPLSVTLGVDVILHEAVVFVVADLLRQEQISRLESGLKHQRQIIFVLYWLLKTASVCLKIHADQHPFVGPGYRTILLQPFELLCCFPILDQLVHIQDVLMKVAIPLRQPLNRFVKSFEDRHVPQIHNV